MLQVLSASAPADYRVHALHDAARDWPETNCYTDLWIELLAAAGLPPQAMLAFTVAQDFEGDQFTFFKPPLEDLEFLFDIRVTELSIFDTVESHAMTQAARGRMPLVEVDSYWLPDTRGVTYRQEHGKTTIAINALDPAKREMRYFHNAGYYELTGEDYDGVFGRLAGPVNQLFPYVEFVKFPARMSAPPVQNCVHLLERHLERRPKGNPFAAWREALPRQLEDLFQRPESYFHTYAFNTLRQFGANYELLAAHLIWLQEHSASGFMAEAELAARLSATAKTMQFQLARAVARKRPQGLVDMVEPLAANYDQLMNRLESRMGGKRAA